MAAALAFAVVFTLSNTNISERERELATIKVLGFRRREVYRYINKETIVLTLKGNVAACPLGYMITSFLSYVLRMPSLFFDTIVEPGTYINKETIVLTLKGNVAACPLGYMITSFLSYVLRMPSLFFDTIVEPGTYVFASVMSLVFTLIINKMTNRSLDKIDMDRGGLAARLCDHALPHLCPAHAVAVLRHDRRAGDLRLRLRDVARLHAHHQQDDQPQPG